MSDITNIGISGLLANQYALTVASQNMASANVPSYSRRMVDFTENSFNQGVSVGDVRRIVDEAANRAALTTKSDFSKMDTYLQQLQGFEPVFDDDGTSISKYITDSLSALGKLNTHASDPASRGLYLTSLAALANRVQNVSAEIARQQQETNQAVQTRIGQINNLLSSIANINTELAGPLNQNTPGLQDKRDGKVAELAQYFNFMTQTDGAGMMSVTLSNGLALVSSQTAATLTTIPDPTDPNNILIAVQNAPGNTTPITNFIQSGELAGITNFRRTVLDQTQRSLGRLSISIAETFNAQNKLGIDINGNLGGDIFNDINNSSAINSRIIPNLNNTGSGGFTVNITTLGQLTTSDYRLTIGAANAYVLTRISDNAIMSSGTISGSLPQTVSADGFDLNINSGTFNSGDQYIVSPTNGAAKGLTLASTDPGRLALGWPVATSKGVQAQGSTGNIKVTAITDTTTSDFSVATQLNPPIKVVFLTATTYQLENATTSAVLEGPITYNPANGTIFPTPGSYDPGYRVLLSGVMQAGDTFNIDYNTGKGDNSNGLEMEKLYRTNILESGTQTLSQSYAALSTAISIETNKAQSGRDATLILKDQAEQKRDAISGVSLQEETMNLARYQQAYQACAQILEVSKTVLETIMRIAG
ncbi:MAG: flagellar hook-associated protein FlgK [Gammaproteobacteria bacterium]